MRAWLLAVVGCTAWSGNPAPPLPSSTPNAPSKPKRKDYVVTPMELGDPGVLDRIPHRVRVRRHGAAGLRADVETLKASSVEELDLLLPVIDETPTKVRIVGRDSDGQSLIALWIPRTDLWSVVTNPSQLADTTGRLTAPGGVWISEGAPVVINSGAGTKWRDVRVHDPEISAGGLVLAKSIGQVWQLDKPEPIPELDDAATECCSLTRDHIVLAPGTNIRAARDVASPVVAVASHSHDVEIAAKAIAWHVDAVEVEVERPHAKVRGFIDLANALRRTPMLSVRGRGRSSLFVTHSDRLQLPAGTCLFDVPNGNVIGVVNAPAERYGTLSTGWSVAYVSTRWGVLHLYVRDVGTDPKVPKWESCLAASGGYSK